MKERIKELSYLFEDKLKDLCGEITPDKRLVVTITMLLLFTALSLYFTFSSVYRFGKGHGENIQIHHIDRLELKLKEKQLELDSIKQLKRFEYERERK